MDIFGFPFLARGSWLPVGFLSQEKGSTKHVDVCFPFLASGFICVSISWRGSGLPEGFPSQENENTKHVYVFVPLLASGLLLFSIPGPGFGAPGSPKAYRAKKKKTLLLAN